MFPALYHQHHALHSEDLPFWLSLTEEYPGKILELGCGTGRVFTYLFHAGKEIFGLDQDYAMLKYFHNRAKKESLPMPQVFQANCSRFRLDTKFNLIIMPCNTYSTLSTIERNETLTAVAEHLTPRGAFVFGIPNPTLMKHMPRVSEPELEEIFIHPEDGKPVHVSSSWQRTNTEFCLLWSYEHFLADDQVQRTQVEIIHQIHPVELYSNELWEHRFSSIELLGDYQQKPYQRSSAILLVKATKG